jgi:phospholipase/carboxylesterase
MNDRVIDDIVALLPPLLHTLEALAFVARHLDPTELSQVVASVGAPEDALRATRPRLDDWPDDFASIRELLRPASDAALAGIDGVRAAITGDGDLRSVFRSLRHLPRAQEAIYPLASRLLPVSQYFLEADQREDAALQTRVTVPVREAETGVIHGGEPGSRGGFSMYVPEYYTAERTWPLVMALHGGSGNGRAFLWSWLRAARTWGAIVVAPTAIGDTWALMGEDIDTPNVERILGLVRERWSIDPARLLLTGMSDGGTFCYVSGLEPASPFTHLAPVAATFHPMLAEMADRERLRDLPITVTHGRLDWMFPVELARQADRALRAAGAAVTYREIADLPHCYPREINASLLGWLSDTACSPGL